MQPVVVLQLMHVHVIYEDVPVYRMGKGRSGHKEEDTVADTEIQGQKILNQHLETVVEKVVLGPMEMGQLEGKAHLETVQ